MLRSIIIFSMFLQGLFTSLPMQALAQSSQSHSVPQSQPPQSAQPPQSSLAAQLRQSYRDYQIQFKQGKYRAAEVHAKKVLRLGEKIFGPNHKNVATFLNNLALIYRIRGRYRQAEQLYKRDLAISEAALGRSHPSVGKSLNNLAELYVLQSRYSAAEPLQKRAVKIFEIALVRSPKDLGKSLTGLAELYRAQGRYREAEPVFKRALAILEKALGQKHRDVATVLNNLAGLYRAQGKYQSAEQIYRKTIAIYEAALGADHPDVATSLNNLAGLYQDQGRYKEAEPLYRRALQLSEAEFGPAHIDVAIGLNNLATLYRNQGRLEEAGKLLRRAMDLTQKALGAAHPDVATSYNNLAGIYAAQDRSSEAESLYRRSLALREKAFGKSHPVVATSLNNLALLLTHQSRFTEAQVLYRRSLAMREYTLGLDHPFVAISHSNLAALYFSRGDWRLATQSWRRATDILIRRAKVSNQNGGNTLGGAKAQVAQNSAIFRGLIKSLFRDQGAGRLSAQSVNEMFLLAQWARSSQAAGALAKMTARGAAGNPALATLVRERQDLVAEWQQRDKLNIAAYSKRAKLRDAKTEAENRARLAVIDKRLNAIDLRLDENFQNYAALVNPRPLPISQVQEQLADEEALVLILDTSKFAAIKEETFIWAVTKNRARMVRIDLGTEALRAQSVALRCGLDRDGEWDWVADKERWIAKSKRCAALWPKGLAPLQQLPFDAGRAHRLYKIMFGQVAELIEGKTLLLVPSGPLTTLPLQVLVTQKTSETTGVINRNQTIAWLTFDHAMTTLPSVANLKSLRQFARASNAGQAFTGFGNPLLQGDAAALVMAKRKLNCRSTNPTRFAAIWHRVSAALKFTSVFRGGGELADVAAIRDQVALPETADELCAIARTIGGSLDAVYLGRRATEERLKSMSDQGLLANTRILHFATHGLLASEARFLRNSAAEPGLILTPPAKATPRDDGFLSASEISTLKLDADWVILSACNTAGGNGADAASGAGEALSGLSRAFFYAGARALLVSHWYVNSNAAVSLTTGAVSAMRNNPAIGRAEALRRSMRALINKGGIFAHPSYWAPFEVVGEGGSGR